MNKTYWTVGVWSLRGWLGVFNTRKEAEEYAKRTEKVYGDNGWGWFEIIEINGDPV